MTRGSMIFVAAALLALGGTATAQSSLVGDRSSLGWADDQAGPLDGADPEKALRDVDTEEARALFTALAGQGCRVDPRTMQRTLAPEGFAFDFVSKTLTDLVVNGVAAMDVTGTIQIPVALCPPTDPAPTPRARVIGAFEANGCRLDEPALREAEGMEALSEAQMTAIVGGLIDAGRLTVSDGTATLGGGSCAGDGDAG